MADTAVTGEQDTSRRHIVLTRLACLFLASRLALFAVGLLSTYAGRGPDFSDWLAGAALNRDRNLRLQYLAGRGLRAQQRVRILDDLLARRRYPADLFTANSILEQSLRDVLK